MRTLSPEEWASILAKAKQKKTQEDCADPTIAPVVQDTTSSKRVKRRRKMGITKPAKVLKAGPAHVISPVKHGEAADAVQAASSEVHSADLQSPPCCGGSWRDCSRRKGDGAISLW
jgi:hypothetical protein